MQTSLSPSERTILDIVRRYGAPSRAAICAECDLAQQSVHRLVEQLIVRGLLRAGEPVKGGRGQPSPRIELVREAVYAIGLSINTDSVALCLADLGCNVIEEVLLPTPPLRREAALAQIGEATAAMLKRNKVARKRVVGVGVAITGFFVGDEGRVSTPEPLKEWSLLALAPMLEAALGLPVWIENNAKTAAIGESLLGVGLWARSFFYLSFNYGFGGGVVIDGMPYFGSHHNAGEMTIFEPDEAERRPALQYLLAELRANGITVDSVEALRERFDPAWPGVEAWLARTLPALDRVINSVAGLVDPEAIVFGGQLPTALGSMMIERAQFYGKHRYGVAPPRPKLVLSEAAGNATVIGAALLPLKQCFFR
ncbi:ROK family transcriptional regulator [Paraburkholderia caledonica]|uniref:NBD/HSP70 family sugar kinase n=1 Tax=Paraburkholderia caledonica TaxID=134536 RepID=A0AB73INH7_9BURK|nr:putative NBD/HSP70 family sugar kinase [Paraburkholderia caledonica]